MLTIYKLAEREKIKNNTSGAGGAAPVLTSPPVMIKIMKSRPVVVVQYISPYPTVEEVTRMK